MFYINVITEKTIHSNKKNHGVKILVHGKIKIYIPCLLVLCIFPGVYHIISILYVQCSLHTPPLSLSLSLNHISLLHKSYILYPGAE